MLEDDFGDVIGKARLGLGLSIDDLARRTRIPPRAISQFEAYRGDPDLAQIARLAEVLGLREAPLATLSANLWAPRPVPQAQEGWAIHSMTMRHLTGFSSNTHLLWREGDRRAAIVDPGFEPGKIRQAVADLGLTPVLIAVTHGHHDHVGAARPLAETYRIPALLGEEDLAIVPQGDHLHLTPTRGGERVALGDAELEVVAAPGHTAGGRLYLVPGACFVGDTLFAASIGRTFGGPPDYPVHLATVRERILTLADRTRLFPGHGPNTTVAEERENNPFG